MKLYTRDSCPNILYREEPDCNILYVFYKHPIMGGGWYYTQFKVHDVNNPLFGFKRLPPEDEFLEEL